MSNKARNQKQKQSGGKIFAAIALAVVAVVVIAISVTSILDNLGVTKRISVAVKSDNFTVTEAELAVYEFQAAQVYSQQYQTEYSPRDVKIYQAKPC